MEKLKKNNCTLTPAARQLRRHMTPEEGKLWHVFLKNYPVRFYRQRVIGHYIADFYCSRVKLVIELDGSQHFEEQGRAYDAHRDAYMNELGLTVIRIPNNEINTNLKGVCEYIDYYVKSALNK